MAVLLAVLCLTSILGAIQGVVEWPDVYYLEGEKIDLVERNVIPFKMWINNKDTQMRVETHNGETIKRFDANVSDLTFMEHYKANKAGIPTLVCSEVSDDSALVEPLPDIEDFVHTGKVILDGKRTQVWTLKDEFIDKRYEETMYVYRKTPVKYVRKTFNTETGNLIENYIVNYSDFTKKVNKDDFKIDETGCEPIYSEDVDFGKSLESHNSHLAFYRFKNYHNRKYGKDEHKLRKKIFKNNWRLVKEHNKKKLGYTLTLNKFADRTPKEMRRINSIRPHNPEPGTHAFPHTEAELEDVVEELPKEFDWRMYGAVTRVKSQGNCGSCWAFATTASIEGALSVKYKTNFDLSEQSVVDCAWSYKVYGCDGGYSERALQYVKEHGIPTENDYGEYLGVDGKCHINNMTRKYSIKGYVAVTPMSVNALKTAVYKNGPVAVYILVTPKMSMYSSGIYYEYPEEGITPNMINHVVVVVGYGVSDGALYWIVKNSYGQDWGEDGYILVSAQDNTGNILYAPYYPIV